MEKLFGTRSSKDQKNKGTLFRSNYITVSPAMRDLLFCNYRKIKREQLSFIITKQTMRCPWYRL
jgi:hypothetical protein